MTTGTLYAGLETPPRPRPSAERTVRPPVVRAWWRDLAGSLTWASILVTVALWVANGGVQQLGSLQTSPTSLGRLTGLLCADLLLIQVLLMARVPFVEKAYGQDELARRHRTVGFLSFNFLIAHIALITTGYAITGHSTVLNQLWDFGVSYPGLLLAYAATGFLVLVTVTSIKRARARIRYESWHLLHLYAYLGVGLAVPHELWAGGDFVGTVWATVYWWALYAAATVAVLYWRVFVPLWRSLRCGLRVTDVVTEGPGVVSVYVSGKRLDRLGAGAGQFFTWRFLGAKGWTRGHPYSLSASPRPDQLRVTIKNLGDGSSQVGRIRPGSRVLVEGPYGRLHAGVRHRRKVVLLASGIGITPMRALLEELRYNPGEVTLIYRASRPEDLVFRSELEELAARRGARVFFVVGGRVPSRNSWLPATAAHLDDAAALRELVPDVEQHEVYLCGADPWMDAARAAAIEAGVPAGNVHLERFSW